MAISLTCPNGHALAVADEHAGKRVMCPMCQIVLEVPAAGTAESIALTCPNGHALMTPAAYAGKKVMCPKCQAVAVVPLSRGAPPPLPPASYTAAPKEQIQAGAPLAREEYGDVTFEEDDRPRRKRRRADWDDEEEGRPRKRRARREADDVEEYDEDRPRRKAGGMKRRQRMKLVNLGLGFHYAGLVLVLVALVVHLFLSFLGTMLFRSDTGGAVLGGLYFLLLVAVVFVTPGLWVTGSVLCLFAPAKSGAFPLILATLILNGVALLISVTLMIVVPPFVFLAGLLSIASWVMFMLFLRALASYLREHGRADEALQLIYFGIALIAGSLVFFAALFALGYYAHAPLILLGLLGLAGGITLLVLEIKFLLRTLILIGSLRQTIAPRG